MPQERDPSWVGKHVQNMTQAEILEWVQTANLSGEELDALQVWVKQNRPISSIADAQATNEANLLDTKIVELQSQADDREEAEGKVRDRAAGQAYEELTIARQSGRPANLDAIEGLDEEGLQQAQDQVASDMARETGADASDPTIQNEVTTLSTRAGNTPRWILESVGLLSEQEKARALEYWNDLYGTTFTNFDRDLAPMLAEESSGGGPTERNQMIIEAAKLNVEPLTTFTVELPGIRTSSKSKLTLSIEEMNVLREVYGLSNDAIAQTIRLAAIHTGDPENVPWQALVALAAASGKTKAIQAIASSSMEANRQQERDRQAMARDRLLPSGEGEGVVARRAIEARARAQTAPDSLQQVQATARSSTASAVTRLMMAYEEGLDRFNHSPVLAFLHAMDPALASRVSQSGGDPRKLTGPDNAKAMKLLQSGGLINRGTSPFEQLGGSSNDSVLRTLGDYFQSFGPEEPEEVPEGPVRQLPDPTAVQENLRQLWVSIFRTEPSAEVQQAFAGELNRVLANAPIEQSIDVTARIQQFIRSQPLYEQMYGNKPSGVTEQEWQAQVLGAVSSILGADVVSEDAVQAGMRAPGSNYQVAVGAAAMSPEAKENSTWLGRLARAAQIFEEQT